ncbi:uncharacterized protein LOC130939344 [Arachis stenosperma]|uniref:uncharacterized protein LOC130939339 n=1 Tax=Arachis stenosperma TaxID=217475 RepID=UPI0025ABD257|nr:uncharacterized protein LOC130939339 [Arachis stenosperma]XP_057723436.1 uncharacterized protein LOC130939344 [Arachis stenosperma]
MVSEIPNFANIDDFVNGFFPNFANSLSNFDPRFTLVLLSMVSEIPNFANSDDFVYVVSMPLNGDDNVGVPIKLWFLCVGSCFDPIISCLCVISRISECGNAAYQGSVIFPVFVLVQLLLLSLVVYVLLNVDENVGKANRLLVLSLVVYLPLNGDENVGMPTTCLTVRCALFGDYVNQVNHFLASGYVEQPVVVIQLAKVKFFRGQVGLQNVMYATQMLFNPDIPEVVDFRQSMIEQGGSGTQPLFIANEGKVLSLEDDFMRLTRKCTIEELQDNNQEGSFIIFGAIQGIVEDGGWWYSACVCGKGIHPQNGAYYCDFCLKHITNVTPRFKIKVTVEDHTGEGIFLLFDREASYLLKKSCADLFTEVQRDASVICGDTYPPIFQGLIGKKLLLKVDTKGVPHDTFYGTFRVTRICDDCTIIAMFELPNYDADDESSPKKEHDLHKSVPAGKADVGIKKESSDSFIKTEKDVGDCAGMLCKSPVLIDFLAEK